LPSAAGAVASSGTDPHPLPALLGPLQCPTGGRAGWPGRRVQRRSGGQGRRRRPHRGRRVARPESIPLMRPVTEGSPRGAHRSGGAAKEGRLLRRAATALSQSRGRCSTGAPTGRPNGRICGADGSPGGMALDAETAACRRAGSGRRCREAGRASPARRGRPACRPERSHLTGEDPVPKHRQVAAVRRRAGSPYSLHGPRLPYRSSSRSRFTRAARSWE